MLQARSADSAEHGRTHCNIQHHVEPPDANSVPKSLTHAKVSFPLEPHRVHAGSTLRECLLRYEPWLFLLFVCPGYPSV